MGKKVFQLIFIIFVIVAFAFTFNSYIKQHASDPEKFKDLITEYPGGYVYRTEPIQIVFSTPFSKHDYQYNEILENDLLTFSPEIKGHSYWVDNKTIEFQPLEPLPYNTLFTGNLNLSEIFIDENPFWNFRFKFKTLPIDIQFTDIEQKYFGTTNQYINITGNISFSDFIELTDVEKNLSAFLKNIDKKILIKYGSNNKTFRFIIDSIERPGTPGNITLKYNITNHGFSLSDSLVINLHNTNQFNYAWRTLNYKPQKNIVFGFTDAIDPLQQLGACISIFPADTFNFYINNNELIIKPVNNIDGEYTITINKNLRSTNGKNLQNQISQVVDFSNLEPKLKNFYHSPIVIIPDSKPVFEFSAINLKSVNVKVYEIAENNVMQYLQFDNLNSFNNLQKVGKCIFTKTVSIDNLPNFDADKWRKYNLTLSEIKANKNGFYHVAIGFDKNNSTIKNCNGQTYDNRWQMFDNNYYSMQNDTLMPCNDSFYGYRKAIKTGLTFSNINITAKLSNTDTLYVFVSNLANNKPLNKCNIEFYDYQKQKTGSTKTNEKGFAYFPQASKIGFIKAWQSTDYNYLKINNHNNNKVKNNYINAYLFTPVTNYFLSDTVNAVFIAADKITTPYITLSITDINNQVIAKQVKPNNNTSHYTFKIPLGNKASKGKAKIIVDAGTQTYTTNINIIPNYQQPVKFYISIIKPTKNQQTNLIKIDATRNNNLVIKNLPVKVEMALKNKETTHNNFENLKFGNLPNTPLTYNQVLNFDNNGKITIWPFKNYSFYKSELYINLLITDIDGSHYKYDTLLVINGIPPYIGINSESGSLNIVSINDENIYTKGKQDIIVNFLSGNTLLDKKKVTLHNGLKTIKIPSQIVAIKPLKIQVYNRQGQYKSTLNINNVPQTVTTIKHAKPITIIEKNNLWAHKKQYNINDTLKLFIESLNNCYAWLIIENTCNIIDYKLVEINKGTNQYNYIVTQNMWPQIKISVINTNAINTKHQLNNNILVNISNNNNQLLPRLLMPGNWEAGKTVEFSVFEQNQNQMYYSVIVFTPNKQINIINPLQYFESITMPNMPVWGNAISTNYDTINKNSLNNALPINNTTAGYDNFKYIDGPFKLNAGQINTHSIKVPEIIGDGQLVILASNIENKQFGTVWLPIFVNSKLLVKVDAQKQVAPSDEIEININIFADNDDDKFVNIDISNPNNLSVNGPTNITQPLVNNKITVPVIVKFKPLQGKAGFKLTVNHHNNTQTQLISFDINNKIPLKYKQILHKTAPNENWHTGFKPVGIRGTNYATITLGKLPNQYPYYYNNIDNSWPLNCEQTVSKVYHLLFIDKAFEIPDNQKYNIENEINQTIIVLKNFQTKTGAFSLIAGTNINNNWLTTYVGHFLVLAQKQGYKIPPGLYNNWLLYQKRQAHTAIINSPGLITNHAYLHYTLALANAPDLELIQKLLQNNNIPDLAKMYCVLAYLQAGKTKLAKQLFTTFGNINTLLQNNNNNNILLCTIATFYYKTNQQSKLNNILKVISGYKYSDNGIPTYTDACTISTIYNCSQQTNNVKKVTYRINKGKENIINSNSAMLITNWPVNFTLPTSVDIKNMSDDTLYSIITYYGLPHTDYFVPNKWDGLLVDLQFFDYNNKPISPQNIPVGNSFYAVVKYTSNTNQTIPHVQGRVIMPSCWQLKAFSETSNNILTAVTQNYHSYDFSIAPYETKSIVYYIDAKTKGNCLMPPIVIKGQLQQQFTITTKPFWVNTL